MDWGIQEQHEVGQPKAVWSGAAKSSVEWDNQEEWGSQKQCGVGQPKAVWSGTAKSSAEWGSQKQRGVG